MPLLKIATILLVKIFDITKQIAARASISIINIFIISLPLHPRARNIPISFFLIVILWDIKLIITTIVGIILAYLFVGLNPIATNHTLPVIFLSGVIAICAMILPGISGSFILLLLGQYEYMLNALNSLNFSEIITFCVGALIGILGFSKLLNYLLENHESITMAFLIGVMIGTLRLPVMMVTTTIPGDLISWVICAVLAIIGLVLIIVLESKFNYID